LGNNFVNEAKQNLSYDFLNGYLYGWENNPDINKRLIITALSQYNGQLLIPSTFYVNLGTNTPQRAAWQFLHNNAILSAPIETGNYVYYNLPFYIYSGLTSRFNFLCNAVADPRFLKLNPGQQIGNIVSCDIPECGAYTIKKDG
jgi:hypothetical protein